MRNVIYGINLTVDGCCDHTKSEGYEEIHDYYTNVLRDVDLLVFGRKTYELMVPFWPDVAKNNSGPTKAMNDFAHAFASKALAVVSRTLDHVEGNTRIIRTNLQEEIHKLKQQDGKSILVGGVDVPSQLIQLGLVDEIHLVVQPIVVGEGRRFMDNISLPEKLRLKLVDSKIFESGCVALRYLKQ